MATKYAPIGHGPKNWMITVNDPKEPPVLASECICGDERCYFIAAVYESTNINLSPVESLKSYIP